MIKLHGGQIISLKMAQRLSSNDGFLSGAGLVFRRSALCLVWLVKVWSITSGCLCRERLFTGERSVVGFLPKGNKKPRRGLGYWLSMPFTNAPARLPSSGVPEKLRSDFLGWQFRGINAALFHIYISMSKCNLSVLLP